jgi:carboxyl-terminal processing protease
MNLQRMCVLGVALLLFSEACGYRSGEGAEKKGKDAAREYSAVFKQVLDLIGERYVDEVDRRRLFKAAMEGMLNEIDEYSAYISPEEYGQWLESVDQEFAGIGIEVMLDPETKRLTVVTPLIGSPAYKAGIRAGDTIVVIDGKDSESMTLPDAVKLMRGRPGEKVRLSVLHKGNEEQVEFHVARAVIKIDSVLGDTRNDEGKWNYFLEKNPRIGYIRITHFGQNTCDELRKAVKFEGHAVDGLILDLRSNPGGLLTEAIAVCDMFIDNGPIVTVRRRDGRVFRQHDARGGKTIVPGNLPVAVLVNGYSASAAEIVAGCLQDHGRAITVGQRTRGKGTVQEIIDLPEGLGSLKLTTASYWRPSGKEIRRKRDATEADDWGVKPNPGFEVKLTVKGGQKA